MLSPIKERMETGMKLICTCIYEEVNPVSIDESSDSIAGLIYNITKLHYNHIYNNN